MWSATVTGSRAVRDSSAKTNIAAVYTGHIWFQEKPRTHLPIHIPLLPEFYQLERVFRPL